MSTAIMSVAFGQSSTHGATPITVSTHYSEWMGRLKVKPGSLAAAESRMPSRH
jgi:hypothetical protein